MAHPEALRPLVLNAARQFNAGRYFEAHEVLEEGLEAVPDELWALFVGLIQIAVGYHKVTQQLWDDARHMLEIGLQKVTVFPGEAAGLNLEALRQRVQADIDQLRRGQFAAQAFAHHPPRLLPLR